MASNLKTAGSSNTFENGLTESGGTVKLGGVLTEPTTIIGDDTTSLTTFLGSPGVTDVGYLTINPPAKVAQLLYLNSVGGSARIAVGDSSGSPYMEMSTNDGTNINTIIVLATSTVLYAYPDSRDDTGSSIPINFLYTDPGGVLQSAPLLAMNSVVSINSTGNVSLSTSNELIDASGGAITRTLPDPTGKNGLEIYLQKTDASGNAVTIATAGGTIIGGITSLGAQYKHVTYLSDGTDWYVKENN